MTDPHHDRRWLILGVIGIAQLLVVLDAAIFAVGALITGSLLRSGVRVPVHGAPEPVPA